MKKKYIYILLFLATVFIFLFEYIALNLIYELLIQIFWSYASDGTYSPFEFKLLFAIIQVMLFLLLLIYSNSVFKLLHVESKFFKKTFNILFALINAALTFMLISDLEIYVRHKFHYFFWARAGYIFRYGDISSYLPHSFRLLLPVIPLVFFVLNIYFLIVWIRGKVGKKN